MCGSCGIVAHESLNASVTSHMTSALAASTFERERSEVPHSTPCTVAGCCAWCQPTMTGCVWCSRVPGSMVTASTGV